MAKKRTPASDLVCGTSRKANWFDSLNKDDREYVMEVVEVMRHKRDSPVYIVAAKLKEELSLSQNRDNVAKKLKELISAKA